MTDLAKSVFISRSLPMNSGLEKNDEIKKIAKQISKNSRLLVVMACFLFNSTTYTILTFELVYTLARIARIGYRIYYY